MLWMIDLSSQVREIEAMELYDGRFHGKERRSRSCSWKIYIDHQDHSQPTRMREGCGTHSWIVAKRQVAGKTVRQCLDSPCPMNGKRTIKLASCCTDCHHDCMVPRSFPPRRLEKTLEGRLRNLSQLRIEQVWRTRTSFSITSTHRTLFTSIASD